MKKKTRIVAVLFLSALVVGLFFSTGTAHAARGGQGGRGDPTAPVIFVTGQGLYYDSIVTADNIPPNGPFQDLMVVDGELQTEFGPGDPGYVGGRWRLLDADGNVIKYFVCPLLGPGRTSP